LLKKVVDLVLTSVLLTLAAPFLLLVALAIKLDSPGPVLFAQRRVGRGGTEFRAWKFRSMVRNADSLLEHYLSERPALQAEWEQNQKLRHDPRITRVGNFLRKLSLDEIPQLWNVMRGEMSLVGPRPIVREEIPRYGKYFSLYTSVQSGLTGLWQVSGRSETSYAERVTFDTFYIRNWSVWLDLYILFRTIGVLWLRTGAY
jgi:Undecaprenyl-phosphate galactose phosphotransferase WbaP